MKVFAHYFYDNKNDVEYRWRTLLKIGDSWEICGTIFMKNPGSSITKDANKLPIQDKSLLEILRKFDDDISSQSSSWYEFTIDNTMMCVERLFETYYTTHHKRLNGVIQIFNLFNIREADLNKAKDKSKGGVREDITYTVDTDIKHIVSPVYIGWGDLWKEHRNNAEKIFAEVMQKSSYLYDGIENNKYYHPQYLMNYGRNNINCHIVMAKFLNNGNSAIELNNINKLISLKRRINSRGAISKILYGTALIYELFCKGVNGKHRRENGVISVSLEINDKIKKYVLSILSKGNHPNDFERMICNYSLGNGWQKYEDNLCFSTNVLADDSQIVIFMTSLLDQMKTYRESDTK